MAKAEKASEPTMDEILASIRKIIAEEPVGKQGSSGPRGGANGSVDQKLPAQRASLDDILGMADPPAPASTRGPISSSSSEPAKKADASSTPASNVSAPEAKSPIDASRPFFPFPAGSKSPETAAADRGVSGGAEKGAATQAVDFGAIVPSKGAAQSAQTDDGDRRSIPGRLPDWLGKPGTATSSASKSAAFPPPAETKAASPVEPAGHPNRKSEIDVKAADAAKTAAPAVPATTPSPAAKPSAAPSAAATSAKAATATGGGQPAPTGGSNTATAKPENTPAKVATPTPTSIPAAAASNTSEKKPAAPAAGTAPASAAANQSKPTQASAGSVPAATPAAPKPSSAPVANGAAAGSPGASAIAKPAAAAATAPVKTASTPVPVAEAASPVAKPAVLDKTKIARPPTASELTPSTLPLGGVRTLDDTIIELLRPMIRQWLDDNMPRMVEKALRVELAASLQSKGATSQTDPSKH